MHVCYASWIQRVSLGEKLHRGALNMKFEQSFLFLIICTRIYQRFVALFHGKLTLLHDYSMYNTKELTFHLFAKRIL